MIKIGNCGWSYLNAKNYFGESWEKQFKTKLQAYVKLFNLVEINSTFYRIPKVKTAEKWRKEADEINPEFEFTIKVSQIITHKDKFSSEKSFQAFTRMKEIANVLRAKILLFQSPASFRPTKENLEKVKNFFEKIKREDLILVWEVRWRDSWTPEIVKNFFSSLDINQCVDPLRQECFYYKDLLYYRLHGFGQPMYNYQFSDEELKKVAEKCKEKTYVLFNNGTCYEDALRFKGIITQ